VILPLSLLLALPVPVPVPVPVQVLPPDAREQRRLELWHEESAWLERLVGLVEAYEEAAPAARRRLHEELEGERRGSRRPGRRPEVEELATLHHSLEGVPSGELRADLPQRFVDAVDLRVVPGAFQAIDDGRGRSLEVWVHSLWHVPWSSRLQLHLDWVAPDGTRDRARSEPFATDSFAGRGFPMFLRAPLGDPGRWQLVPVLEVDGRFVDGFPAPVEAVDDLEFRITLVDPAPVAWSGGQPPLFDLRHYGIRSATGTSMSIWLEHRAGFALPRPVFVPSEAIDPDLRPFELVGVEEPEWTVVHVAPGQERSETLDALCLGRASSVFASTGIGCVSVEARRESGQDLVELVTASKAEERRVALLARGDAVTALHLLASRGELEVDALVLVSPVAPGPALPDVPLLWVRTEFLEGADVPELGREAKVEVRADSRPDWLISPEVPALVSGFLAEL